MATPLAFIALLAALSGTAVALPGEGRVDSGDLRDNSVRGQDLRANSITARELRRRSLDGTDIKINRVGGDAIKEEGLELDKLGKVPSAAMADRSTSAVNAITAVSAGSAASAGTASSAGTADTAGNADRVDGHHVGCPAATVRVVDVCIETAQRIAGTTMFAASDACGAVGRRLPAAGELFAYEEIHDPELGLGGFGEYSADVYFDGVGVDVVLVDNGPNAQAASVGEDRRYRCVASVISP